MEHLEHSGTKPKMEDLLYACVGRKQLVCYLGEGFMVRLVNWWM